MSKNSVAWRPLVRSLLKLPYLMFGMAVLFCVALVLAMVGRREILDQMLTTFRKWHILPPKTAEERLELVIFQINVAYLTQGLGLLGLLFYVIWRSTGRKVLGHFLEDKLSEFKAALGPDYVKKLAARDDLGLVIGVTSLLDKFIALLIVSRFLVSISKQDYERVFEGQGPLSTFSAKIAMGKTLGLLLGDMANDLTIMRKIRNDFAHAVGTPSLIDTRVSSRCGSLKMSSPLSSEIVAACTLERRKLLESVSAQLLHMTVILQRTISERVFVLQNSKEIARLTSEGLKDLKKILQERDAAST